MPLACGSPYSNLLISFEFLEVPNVSVTTNADNTSIFNCRVNKKIINRGDGAEAGR